MESLRDLGCAVFLEASPKPQLLGMGSQCLPEDEGVWLPSLRPSCADWEQMLLSLGELYVRGAPIDWIGFDQDYARSRVILPTYPFQQQRCWVDAPRVASRPTPSTPEVKGGHPLLGRRLHIAGAREIRFQSRIDQGSLAILQNHRVFDEVILPVAAYIEMALAGGRAVLRSDDLVLEDIVLQQALLLAQGQQVTLQVVLSPQEARSFSFQVFSLEDVQGDGEGSWVLHASGKILERVKVAERPRLASLMRSPSTPESNVSCCARERPSAGFALRRQEPRSSPITRSIQRSWTPAWR
jgi:acyl transferase domain-containing protein